MYPIRWIIPLHNIYETFKIILIYLIDRTMVQLIVPSIGMGENGEELCYPGAIHKCQANSVAYYDCCFGNCCIHLQPYIIYSIYIMLALIGLIIITHLFMNMVRGGKYSSYIIIWILDQIFLCMFIYAMIRIMRIWW